jgi:release factor glutamine methyltransferase
MNLADWVRLGAAQLGSGPHPERAERDAETLMLHLIERNRAYLLAHPEAELAAEAEDRYSALIQRRFAGEPIQYITGECEFYGLPFRVTRDVLIPRPETEHLVEKVAQLAASFVNPRIVDIGTGSGAIAVALAHLLPSAQITAIDLSASALHVARANAERNGVAGRIRFVHGDLFEPVSGEFFEIAVSNPPYVPENDRNALAVEVREHEPELALFAGADGLDVYRRLIPAARATVVPGGFLALEIGSGQAAALAALLAEAGFEQIEFTPDLQGIDRVVTCRAT